jgi:hypothetical protein
MLSLLFFINKEVEADLEVEEEAVEEEEVEVEVEAVEEEDVMADAVEDAAGE